MDAKHMKKMMLRYDQQSRYK